MKKRTRSSKKLIDYGQMHRNDAVTLDYFAVSLPDLLIFDSDLNMLNRIHCLYVIALGFLGLEDYQKAEDFFRQLLALDCSHAGTRLHLEIIRNLRIV
jgi:hypothetical protein